MVTRDRSNENANTLAMEGSETIDTGLETFTGITKNEIKGKMRNARMHLKY